MQQIEELFYFGIVDQKHVVRDVAVGKSDYHINRVASSVLLEKIKNGATIVLLVGEICDGKSLLVDEMCATLSLSRPIFKIKHIYNDLLDEAANILSIYPSAVFVIENCFDIDPARLFAFSKLCDGGDALAVLTSRDIAAEAESPMIKRLETLDHFVQYRIERLVDSEIEALINLADQISAWVGTDVLDMNSKKNYITKKCNSSFPSFLLRVLKSENVRNKYKEE